MIDLLERIVMLIVSPFAYTLLYVLMFIDTMAYRIDRRFHTQLRTPKITVEEVQCLIETYIQTGSTKEDVFIFLQQFNLPDSDRIAFPDDEFMLFQFKSHKLEKEGEFIKGCVGARVEDVGKSLLVRNDVLIFFYYDEQNKLIRYITEGIYTGL
jgi:hypothetical protein